MTSYRFEQLRKMSLNGEPIPESELAEFNSTMAWFNRSQAAKRAVQTKREKYKTWPSRKGDHK